jgi:hypothetical protein
MSKFPYSTANSQQLRKAHLAAYPWCEGCKAIGKPYMIANTVDHVCRSVTAGLPPGHDGLASYINRGKYRMLFPRMSRDAMHRQPPVASPPSGTVNPKLMPPRSPRSAGASTSRPGCGRVRRARTRAHLSERTVGQVSTTKKSA